NAILLAALLLVPTRTWWLLLLAVLPAHVLVEAQNGIATWTILGLYVTNCGQALLGAAGIVWLSGGVPRLDNLRGMVTFVACAVLIAPLLVSFLDTGVIVLTARGESIYQYSLLWGERFISNALTALALPPIILVTATSWRERQRQASPDRYF